MQSILNAKRSSLSLWYWRLFMSPHFNGVARRWYTLWEYKHALNIWASCPELAQSTECYPHRVWWLQDCFRSKASFQDRDRCWRLKSEDILKKIRLKALLLTISFGKICGNKNNFIRRHMLWYLVGIKQTTQKKASQRIEVWQISLKANMSLVEFC